MQRLALTLCLVFATSVAQASTPAPAEPETGACAKTSSSAEKPAESPVAEPATTPGATAPVRPRTGSASGRPTPRWNSLLPGMIR
ncbi:MAG: hypothetical protein CL625_06760 [Arenimonas sp.]|nr:hypothetical protein [Arenimonas sp.]